MKLLQDRDRRDQERNNHFVRACVVEMHMDIWQEQFYARIYSEKAGDQKAYPDYITPALTPTVRTPQWTHCLRKNNDVCDYFDGEGDGQ